MSDELCCCQAEASSVAEDGDPHRKELQPAEEHAERPQPAHGQQQTPRTLPH